MGPKAEEFLYLLLWTCDEAQIIAGAWDFSAINQRYADYMKLLETCPKEALNNMVGARRVQQWLQLEREAWIETTSMDPLLPDQLLPKGYLGKAAWTARVKTLAEASEQMRSFHP